jgi:hypothetical protein
MKPSIHRVSRILAKVFLYAFGTAGILSIVFWWGCTPPSDTNLLNRFQRHRNDFQTLVSMSSEDSRVIRIAPDFTRLEDDWSWPRAQTRWGITPQRWDDYRRLFRETGLSGGLYRSPNSKQVFLLAWSEGIVGRGTYLGYVYCGDVPTDGNDSYPPCTEQKDSFEGRKYRYRKIGDQWYIWEDWS